ncbi:MAG: hypothetical protein HOB62_10590 [Gammaproteobacteria bacterium]|nr:hypothetical protein [Gammaproteobacteria bacterium]MBT4659374.1 hypothetical protein [Gammaproteobacteria bacterium]MBT4892996.1 hypothetical protein [Gammaproteobacteria bacterium]MBT5509902.1 hypothetical protein [Gammaproteobacteria bacterium]MBT5742923.1 hypothetical protein [Gammaproteobacteria bacterium]
MKKCQTMLITLILPLVLAACGGGSPAVDSFIDSYEEAVVGFENMAGKSSTSIQDINEMTMTNMAMASKVEELKNENWTDAQRKEYLELTNRFSQALLRMSK